MATESKKNKWLAGSGSLVACFVAVALMRALPVGSGGVEKLSPREQAELGNAVTAANQASTIAYRQQVNAWRYRLGAARSPQRLKAFVGELLSIEQKFKSSLTLVNAGTGDDERVRRLFREQILDERTLAADLTATIDGYERALFEQDRQVFEAAGISREEWNSMVRSAKPSAAAWSQAVQPVITRAVYEARQDVARFAATWVASDWAGDGIKRAAREAGWDKSEPDSWGELISGFVIDVAASAAIDAATDPTDRIVSRLGSELASAEHALLDGENGLLTVMRRIALAHESARNSVLTIAQGR
jgi:hypothetical protein